MKRYRVKVRSECTVDEYVVEAASRDDAWLHVARNRADLVPDTSSTNAEGVYWASAEPVEVDP